MARTFRERTAAAEPPPSSNVACTTGVFYPRAVHSRTAERRGRHLDFAPALPFDKRERQAVLFAVVQMTTAITMRLRGVLAGAE